VVAPHAGIEPGAMGGFTVMDFPRDKLGGGLGLNAGVGRGKVGALREGIDPGGVIDKAVPLDVH